MNIDEKYAQWFALTEGKGKKVNPPAVVKAWADKIGMSFDDAYKRC